MILRKIAFDNCVNYVPQIEQTQDRDSKPNTIRKNTNSRKQNKIFSQNKKILENLALGGFVILK